MELNVRFPICYLTNKGDKMQEWEKAYLAGFIDADGAITINKQKRSSKWQKHTYYYRLMLSIANRHLGALKWMQEVTKCEGSLFKRNLHKKHPAWSDAWQLRWNSKQMYRILTEIRPYMIMKGRHADLAMEMIELKRGTLALSKVKQHQQFKLMAKDYLSKLDRYEEIYQEIKKLNKTGQEYIENNGVNSGKLHHLMDNPEPSRVNGMKVARKVQRLTGEQPSNKPDTSAPPEREEIV